MRYFNQKIWILAFFAILFLPTFQKVEAKSVTYSKTETEGYDLYGFNIVALAYYWNCSGDASKCRGNSGWLTALYGPSYSVSYEANVYNADTDTLISDGSTVAIGTRLRFVPKGYSDSDISWFGSGVSSDSPFGHWISNAAAPSFACLSGDQSGTNVYDEAQNQYNVYTPFSVNPPANSLQFTGTTAGLTNQGSNIYRVDSAGTIKAQFIFSSTYGEFYYRYLMTVKSYSGLNINTCYGNQVALDKDLGPEGQTCYGPTCPTPGATHEDYQAVIPQQSVDFTFTVPGPANTAPNPPTITGPTTGTTGTSYSFGFQASDPDSNTVRYGVDWDKDGGVDQWLPSSGYVASNTSQSGSRSWPTDGAHPFQALTQDVNNANSTWTQYSITTSTATPAPAPNLKINNVDGPITVAYGANFTLSWASVANATSCTGTGTGWAGTKAVGGASNVLNANFTGARTYTLICSGPGGSNIPDSVTVNVTAPPAPAPDLKVNGGDTAITIASNAQFTLSWGAVANATSCYSSVNWDGLTKSISGGSENKTTASTQTYTLYCTGPGGDGSNSVTVNIVGAPAPNLKVNASDGPLAVNYGSNITVSWPAVANATSCTATGINWNGVKSVSGGSETVASASINSTYKLDCTGTGGTGSDSVIVNITPPPAPVPDLKVNGGDAPITVISNTPFALSWANVANASNCYGTGTNWTGNKAPTGGNDTVATPTTSSYILDCTGPTGLTGQDTVTVNTTPPPPSANLTINGSDADISVALGSTLNIAWSSANVTSCTGIGVGWSNGAIALTGTASTTANQGDNYIFQCTNGSTTVTDSIRVTLTDSLKICQTSCVSGSTPNQSFTLASGGTRNLVACFNPRSDCNPGVGGNGNVTSATTWTEFNNPDDSFSLSGTDPKTVTGNTVTGSASAKEGLRANYSSQTSSLNVTVTCVPTVSCGNAPSSGDFCKSETFTVDNGCGTTLTCNGVKTCDYNLKEVAP